VHDPSLAVRRLNRKKAATMKDDGPAIPNTCGRSLSRTQVAMVGLEDGLLNAGRYRDRHVAAPFWKEINA
jgi:hypothetical protein